MSLRPLCSNSTRALSLALALCVPVQASFAQSCDIDLTAVEDNIKRLEPSYGDILSDISCDAPTNMAHQIMCDSASTQPAELWRMGRLDDLAWVYAYENATKREVDHDNPPRATDFLTKRDACTDALCLCDELIAHTNASLGGESPYRTSR